MRANVSDGRHGVAAELRVWNACSERKQEPAVATAVECAARAPPLKPGEFL
jgi:hypothetical protein